MSTCCEVVTRKSPVRLRSVREGIAWLVPTVVLVLVPKCPACLAAHVAIWTGLGLSFTAATYLRWGLLLVCGASLLFLSVERLRRVYFGVGCCNKEIQSCPTK